MNPWKREAPSPIQWRAQGTSIERTVRVITLMHGGGPVSSEEDHPQHPTRRHDEVTILRGSEPRRRGLAGAAQEEALRAP